MCTQVLGGGQYNGQYVVFDTRHGSAAVDATPIEKSHRCASCQHLNDGMRPRGPVMHLSQAPCQQCSMSVFTTADRLVFQEQEHSSAVFVQLPSRVQSDQPSPDSGVRLQSGQLCKKSMRPICKSLLVQLTLRLRRDPIYDFAWLQSKTGTEAMTVSSDGRVLW